MYYQSKFVQKNPTFIGIHEADDWGAPKKFEISVVSAAHNSGNRIVIARRSKADMVALFDNLKEIMCATEDMDLDEKPY